MTALVSIEDGRLRIHRTGVARWLGKPLDVPLAHVASVNAAEPHNLKERSKGIRLAGIQIPGLMTSGTYRHEGKLTWWDVGRGARTIVITFRDERLARAVVEVDHPAAVIRALDQALAGAALPGGVTVK